jgi:hypothetical protein
MGTRGEAARWPVAQAAQLGEGERPKGNRVKTHDGTSA